MLRISFGSGIILRCLLRISFGSGIILRHLLRISFGSGIILRHLLRISFGSGIILRHLLRIPFGSGIILRCLLGISFGNRRLTCEISIRLIGLFHDELLVVVHHRIILLWLHIGVLLLRTKIHLRRILHERILYGRRSAVRADGTVRVDVILRIYNVVCDPLLRLVLNATE